MLQPNFNPFPKLQTNRLLLRRMTMEDKEEVFFLRSDKSVLQFIRKEPEATLREAEEFIERIDNILAANDGVYWAIALKDNPSKLIGTICYWNLRKEDERAEVGYALHPDHWRKGIMKEALNAVINYGFNTLGLHSIEGQMDANHKASAGLLESNGFVREALFREDFFYNGKYFDSAVYSLLAPK